MNIHNIWMYQSCSYPRLKTKTKMCRSNVMKKKTFKSHGSWHCINLVGLLYWIVIVWLYALAVDSSVVWSKGWSLSNQQCFNEPFELGVDWNVWNCLVVFAWSQLSAIGCCAQFYRMSRTFPVAVWCNRYRLLACYAPRSIKNLIFFRSAKNPIEIIPMCVWIILYFKIYFAFTSFCRWYVELQWSAYYTFELVVGFVSY